MNNPYKPPQAEPLLHDSLREASNYEPKRSMFTAGAILTAIGVISALYEYFSEGKYGAGYTVTYVLTAAPIAWYGVVVINAMGNGKTSKGVIRQFGVWAFVWRALITSFLCFVPMYLMVSPFYPNYMIVPSALTVLIGAIFYLIFAPVMVWIFFSNGRRQQLYWLSTLLARV